jgi:hypothetical protein
MWEDLAKGILTRSARIDGGQMLRHAPFAHSRRLLSRRSQLVTMSAETERAATTWNQNDHGRHFWKRTRSPGEPRRCLPGVSCREVQQLLRWRTYSASSQRCERAPNVRPSRRVGARRDPPSVVTWLILPVVICLSQRLSHACLSISNCIQ